MRTEVAPPDAARAAALAPVVEARAGRAARPQRRVLPVGARRRSAQHLRGGPARVGPGAVRRRRARPHQPGRVPQQPDLRPDGAAPVPDLLDRRRSGRRRRGKRSAGRSTSCSPTRPAARLRRSALPRAHGSHRCPHGVLVATVALGSWLVDLEIGFERVVAASVSAGLLALLYGAVALAAGALGRGEPGRSPSPPRSPWVLDLRRPGPGGRRARSVAAARAVLPRAGPAPAQRGISLGSWALLVAGTAVLVAAAATGLERRDIRQ